jgi:hypothetical protein
MSALRDVAVLVSLALLLAAAPAWGRAPSATGGASEGSTVQRFAYATVYTHGAPEAEAVLLGLRVMMQTLRLTQPVLQPREEVKDLVVLVSPDTPLGVRDQLTADGLRVIDATEALSRALGEVEMMSVFGGRRANDASRFLQTHCRQNLDFLYLWTLVQYERVVYVAPDELVYENLDDLFACGRFCMTYTNPYVWTCGLLVIKPEKAAFEALLNEFHALSERLYRGGAPALATLGGLDCDGHHYDLLLSAFRGVEQAPLFSIERPPERDEPVMRLAPYFEINALFYYELFHWDLYHLNMRVPANSSAKRLRYDNAVVQRHRHRIPTFAASFVTPRPFYYAPAFFFDLTWEWQFIRAAVLPDETSDETRWILVSRSAFLLIAGVFFVWLAQQLGAWGSVSGGTIPDSQLRACGRAFSSLFFADLLAHGRGSGVGAAVAGAYGAAGSPGVLECCRLTLAPLLAVRRRADLLGGAVGLMWALLVGLYVAYGLVPRTTVPWVALPLWMVIDASFVYAGLVLWHAAMGAAGRAPVRHLLGATVVEALVVWIDRLQIHVHFVEKCAIAFSLIGVVLLLQITPFRAALLEHVEQRFGLTSKKADATPDSDKDESLKA